MNPAILIIFFSISLLGLLLIRAISKPSKNSNTIEIDFYRAYINEEEKIHTKNLGGAKTIKINYTTKEIEELSATENERTKIFIEAFIKSSPRTRETKNNKERKTYIDSDGYLRFKKGDLLVHRWVATKKIGRRLRKGEVVHHCDGDKLNNRPENLKVFKNQHEHNIHHYNNLKKTGRWYEKISDYRYSN